MPIAETTIATDGRRTQRFVRSPRFSTYLLALVAGPYHSVRTEHDGIPLGLYGRQSMARLLDHHSAELLEVTRQGFDFFRVLFDQPYPFSKYDQLFMPEFNVGAMENVGAVTFHDGYLFRDPATGIQRMERAEVQLHELAHMWFGNLVTMRWWDDLWLNESFATWVSFLALDRATRFERAWQVFNGSLKPAAYRQDQLVTTHPVAADVPDTDTALLNFDGITYEKGAAVLKQLAATIGEDAFVAGIREYFRRHAWGNATLADFLGALGDAAGRSLTGWADVWLRTPSINTISAQWSVAEGAIDRMTLHQTAPAAHPWLRPHTMELCLVDANGSGPRLESVMATIDGPSADVADVVGRAAPQLVFPNYRDHDYAKATLDPVSLDFARQRLDELTDPFLRQLLWTSLWDMVRDAQLPSTEFLAMVGRMAVREQDPELLSAILDRARTSLRWYVPESTREAEASATVEAALGAVRAAAGSDLRLIWLRAAIAAAARPRDLEPLLAFADGDDHIDGVQIDQEMRWTLAIKSVAFGMERGSDRTTVEADRDPSDRGQRFAIRARTARPDADAKAEAWSRIHDQGYGSLQLTRAAMEGFQWPGQRTLLRPYREQFFEQVRGVFRTQDHPFARAYLSNLFPGTWAEPEVLDAATNLIAELAPGETTLDRQLREAVDDLERAIRARAFAAGSPTAA
jgi:aminopeptidase N